MSGPPTFDTGHQFAVQIVPGATSQDTGAVTTTETNAVIVILVCMTADADDMPGSMGVSGITGGGLTFQQYVASNLAPIAYAQVISNDPFYYNGTGAMQFEVWWAAAPAILSGVVFTISTSEPVRRGGIAGVPVYGCGNLAAPWDTNAFSPVVSGTLSGDNSVTITTDAADVAVCVFFASVPDNVEAPDPPWPDPPEFNPLPSGFSSETGVLQFGTGGDPFNGPPHPPSFDGELIGKASVAAVTGLVVPITATFNPPLNGLIMIGAALTSAPPPPKAILNLGDVIVTSLAVESPCTVAQYLTPPPVSPAMGLRWSDTRGASYGNAVAQALGTNPLTQLQWNRTGYARDRVFELFWSAASKTALNGAFILVEPWKS